MAAVADRTLGDFYWPALLKSGLSPDAPPGGRGEDHFTWSRLLKGDRALPEGRILPGHQIRGAQLLVGCDDKLTWSNGAMTARSNHKEGVMDQRTMLDKARHVKRLYHRMFFLNSVILPLFQID
jgi:hypothetical protein